MKKIKNIIIGANGYLGKNLAWYLYSKGEITQCFGRSLNTVDDWLDYQVLDVSDKEQVKKINFDCDNVFMFAGLTGAAQGFDDFERYNNVNVNGLANVLNEMKFQNSEARLVFPSTRLVYKGQENSLLVEAASKDAKTVYALNKLTCESLLKMYGDIFQINYSIFRIGVPYGHILTNSYSYGTIGFFISNAEKEINISLYGDGELRRTFTHVSDICEVIIKAISLPNSNKNIYNIGGENLSLKEAAEIVVKKYKNSGIDFVDWPEMAFKIESGDTVFNDEKLKKIIGEDYLNHTLEESLL